jgi:hypothetical protein
VLSRPEAIRALLNFLTGLVSPPINLENKHCPTRKNNTTEH